MPLFKIVDDEFVQWLGEPINDIPYPFNIEDMWTYTQLESIGLYRPLEPEEVPEGYEVISTKPGWDKDGYVRYIHELKLISPEDIIITPRDINEEAISRIEGGIPFNGKIFDNDALSNRRITRAGTLAATSIILGAEEGNYYWHLPPDSWDLSQEDKDLLNLSPFTWIVKDNSLMLLDAYQTIELSRAAADWEQAHVFAARALKDMDPIPHDYKDAQYWP